MELNRFDIECLIHTKELKRVGLRNEDRVRDTFETSHDVGTKVVDGTDEIFVPHQHVGHEVAENDGADPGTNEALNSLLRRQLDQLGATKSDSADVGKDVVRDYQRCRKEEPDHALEDVVHHEVRLDDNQVQRHVSPSELSKLEAVVSLLKRPNEEDEA